MSIGCSRACCIDNLIILSSCATLLIAIVAGNCGLVGCYPTASVNLFSHANKFDEKPSSGDESAEQSFQQFIYSKPGSTFITELKPNSSTLEMMLIKEKIASAILSMQEMEKAKSARSMESTGGDCFIETTKVERIPGKCHKVYNGLPICQSDDYMAISTDCS